MKFSACIEMIFQGLPFEQRIAAAKAAGADAVEFWGWPGKDLDAIARETAANDIPVSVFCVVSADPATQSALVLTRPEGRDALPRAVEESCAVAHRLGVRTLIVTTGNEQSDLSREAQHRNVVEALRAAAPVAQRHGITLVLEPLNVLVNHKGYYLSTSAEGFAIVDEVGSPAVKLLFDMYHQQITEGNLTDNIRAGIAKIGHFHLADVPGRHEPGTGELNYAHLFRIIEAAGYDRYVGMEFTPTGDDARAVAATQALR